MHYWGDEWFQKYGDELYKAIDEIEREMRKYRIRVYGKEKWGCYVPEYLGFWDCGLYELLFGYRAYIGTYNYKGLYKYTWFVNFIDAIHKFINFTIDQGTPRYKKDEPFESFSKRYEKRIWKGLCYYMNQIGITKLIQKWQASKVNRAYQIVCKKHPNIVDELTCDGYTPFEMIKPCKYGPLNGEEIEKKFWVKLP